MASTSQPETTGGAPPELKLHRNFAGLSLSIGPDSENEDCPICQDSVGTYARMWRHATCRKYFHNKCLEMWFMAKQTQGVQVRCPLCQDPLVLTEARKAVKESMYRKIEDLCNLTSDILGEGLEEARPGLTRAWEQLVVEMYHTELADTEEYIEIVDANSISSIDTQPGNRPQFTAGQLADMIGTEVAVNLEHVDELSRAFLGVD